MNTDKNMNIEDLFTDMERKDKVPARKGRGRGKKSMADLFTELKVQMVMNIYTCSAERAKEIIDCPSSHSRSAVVNTIESYQ